MILRRSELAKKEQIKEAAAKRREKAADVAAKKKIRAKIAADKEERGLRAERKKAEQHGRAAVAVPAAAIASPGAAGPVTSKPASAYTETRMRFQTPKGNVMKSVLAATVARNAVWQQLTIASRVGDKIGR